MSTVTRYIAAIMMMTKSTSQETRTWAKSCVRDMAEPGVNINDYLHPMMTLSVNRLDQFERVARNLACSSVTIEQINQPAKVS